MKKIKLTVFILTIAASAASYAYCKTGFFTGEQISGMNKICFYDVLGSTMTINISTTNICPVTYQFCD